MEFDTHHPRGLTAGKPLHRLRPFVVKSDSGCGAIEMLLIQSRLRSMEFLRQCADE